MSEGSADAEPKPRVIRNGGTTLTIGYFTVWLIFIYAIYRFFKKRGADPDGYFGVHRERIAYRKAVAAAPEDPSTEELEQLRKLLIRRVMENVRRIWKMQNDRESIYALMRSGAIEEQLWKDFKAAEADMQLEIYDVQAEAETFKEGWSTSIIRDAAELCRKEESLLKLLKESKKKEKKLVKSKAKTESQSTVKDLEVNNESEVSSPEDDE